MSRLRRYLLTLFAVVALTGCINVPQDIRADFDPPDGKRPNNYGKFQGEGDAKVVVPDRPTIPRAKEDS